MTTRVWKKAALLLLILLGLDVACVALFVDRAYRGVRQNQGRESADAAVVFFGGEPLPPLLAIDVDKLDLAADLSREGVVRNVVCVGGSRSYTERVGARMMRDYLLQRGVPEHRVFAATVRRHSFTRKEKKLWVIKEKRTKAKRNNRKRPSLIQKKNEK